MQRLNGHSHLADQNEDLGKGPWAKEQLEAMDAAFTAALERAFELGLESRASAANQVRLPATLGPRQVSPLTTETRDALWRSAASGATCFVARG